MSAKLVSITQCHDGVLSPEELISYTARVSNPANQMNKESAAKLIKYLIANKHWSPFEMVSMCVEISTSRAIAAQILRHRSFSFQEFSQRYSQANYFVMYQARRQDTKNRQNSIDDLPIETQEWFDDLQKTVWESAELFYLEALERGIAKECARMILPLNTGTTIYMSGTVRSWIHYLETRTHPSAQLEHREIANQIKEIFQENFPNISEALEWTRA